MLLLKKIQRILFGEPPAEKPLKYIEIRIISKEEVTVPENRVWVALEILVDDRQTHSWFLFPPFNSMYRFSKATIKGNSIYLFWTLERGKVKKAKSSDIGNCISVKPVWFPPGTKISMGSERAILRVYELEL